jgi:hypothetical protein
MACAWQVSPSTREDTMANDDRGFPFLSPVPLLAAALLAAGVLVKNVALETARPASDDRIPSSRQLGQQDVEARLWQDPLAVRAVALPPSADLRKRRDLAKEDPEHAPGRLSQLVDRELDGAADLEIVGAMVFGGTYAEDSEARRRTRYAVVSGLQRLGYDPVSPDMLGYAWLPDEPRVKADLGARLPEILPYEWFTRSHAGRESKLLLVWIQEDALGDKPVRSLNRVAEMILCQHSIDEAVAAKLLKTSVRGKDLAATRLRIAEEAATSVAQECADRKRRTRLRIIGPAGSDTLAALRNEVRQFLGDEYRPVENPVWLEFFSAGGTIADSQLVGVDFLGQVQNGERRSDSHRVANEYRLKLWRLTVTDDRVAGALADELVSLRGLADRKAGLGATDELQCGTVVLVSEADTRYGRTLGAEVSRAIAKRCEEAKVKGPTIVQARYFRGLDGLLTSGPGSPSGRGGDGSGGKKRDRDELELRTAGPDRAEGPSQVDYLRRLSDELIAVDEAERRAGGPGVRAVGVLGSDVYDKLLILQALHGKLAHAVFFTTDLDARLLHPDQSRWARNLVVASSYGLSLREQLQGPVPAFRDSYQTGTYFATLTALNPDLQRAFSHGTANTSANTQGPQTLGEQWFLRAQLFEIGRSHAIELTRGGGRLSTDGDADTCALGNPTGCALIAQDPQRTGTSQIVKAMQSHMGLFGTAAVSGVLFVFLTSRTARRRPLTVLAATLAAAGVLGFVTMRAIADDESGRGEPLEWLEGVSLWPTVYLRILAIIATLILLAYGWRMIRDTTVDLHRRFFAAGRSARAERGAGTHRSKLRDGLAGYVERFVTRMGLRLMFIEHRSDRRSGPPSGVPDRRHGSAFLPVDAYAVDPDDLRAHVDPSNGRLHARSLWRAHCCNGRFWPAAVRIGIMSALFFGFTAAIFYFDPPNLPYRGAEVKTWTTVTTVASIVGLWVLVFAVVDVTRRATRLVRAMSDREVEWPQLTMTREGRATGLRGSLLAHWIKFRVIVELTKSVSVFIYFPFVVLVLLIIARSTLFDSLNFPLPLLLLFGAALGYLVYSSATLRRAAEHARERVLETLDDQLLHLKAGTVPAALADSAPEGHDPRRGLRDSVEELRRRVERTREGAFAPFFSQPFVKAVMIPFGGFGGISLLEYFAVTPF